MSTITSSGGQSFFRSIKDSLKQFKEKYCPNGQTCNDLLTLGGIVFCFLFMYIAMEPLWRHGW